MNFLFYFFFFFYYVLFINRLFSVWCIILLEIRRRLFLFKLATLKVWSLFTFLFGIFLLLFNAFSFRLTFFGSQILFSNSIFYATAFLRSGTLNAFLQQKTKKKLIAFTCKVKTNKSKRITGLSKVVHVKTTPTPIKKLQYTCKINIV